MHICPRIGGFLMVRMIPGRIRNKGIELYDSGKVKILDKTQDGVNAEVDGNALFYSLQDEKVTCQCAFFAKKNYCEHIAALEYYLKNTNQGKAILDELQQEHSNETTIKKKNSFGSLFLDGIEMNEDETTLYRLSAYGSQSPYSSDFWWSLKINRLPDERSYVVRDIKGFLNVVKSESFYQIGKNYYEPLSLLQFDEESQDLIQFLWRLIPENDKHSLETLFPNHGRNLRLPVGLFEEGLHLMNHLYEFLFEDNNKTYKQVYFQEIDQSANLFQFEVVVHLQSFELKIIEKNARALFQNTFLLYQNTFYHLNYQQSKLISAIRSLPLESDLSKHIFFDLEDQTKLVNSLLTFKTIGEVKAPKSFTIMDFDIMVDFDLMPDDKIKSQITFDYGNVQVSSNEEMLNLPFASHYKKEESLMKLLKSTGFTTGFTAFHAALDQKELYRFFTKTLPQFEKLAVVSLSADIEALRYTEKPKIEIERQAGLLDISFDFSSIFQNDVDQALKALFDSEPYFINKAGKLVVFDEETQKISQTLQTLRAKHLKNGHIQLDQLAAFQVADIFDHYDNISFSESFRQLAYDLRHPEAFELPRLSLNAELRDYQMIGIKWLAMLNHYGFGGILADDMGLGKTLQTIAFLSTILEKNTKVLILAPSSLIYNWKDEFQKFAPTIDVAVSYGLKHVRMATISEDHQVVVTSYASFRQDFNLFQEKQFDYLILDEAQVMKNNQTKIAQKLRDFDVKNCFALSGTPIENNLTEIWSIFQIVLPGLLPKKKAFSKLDASQVAKAIQPFIMRRKKEDVLPELPDLIEMNYTSELADSQKAIYLAQLSQIQESLLGATDDDINKRKIEILSGITRLRQICDTPSLFMNYKGGSGKIDSLRELLAQIKENGHRALIFSQFRGMLDKTKEEMDKIGLSSYMMTGSTPSNDRQEMTRAFNNGSKDAFLISLKAGGVGLNLTGADTVILIDLWWNPAVENQAISRAHRIGQKQNVEVYRLITRGTIEEKILELQESKKNLVTTVLDGEESRSTMSIEDIREILGIKDYTDRI